MSKPKTTDFGTAGKATIDMGEDVLAGAVNGNLHPETISDYSPERDSAFESVTGGSGAAAAKASKPAARKMRARLHRRVTPRAADILCRTHHFLQRLRSRTIPTGTLM